MSMMTLLKDAMEAKKFDSRIQERSLQKGLLKAEELKKQTDLLPDDADNAEYVSIETIANDPSLK